MKIKSPGSRGMVLGVFLILLVLCEASAYVATLPRTTEDFFQFYLLGENGSLTGYFSDNTPEIGVGARIAWVVGARNLMGNVQLVEILVKLANETILPPNDTNYTPSPAPILVMWERFLLNNETWQLPFTWSIVNATTSEGSTRILTMQIDNQTYQVPDWSALHGQNFRLVFELWVWNNENDSFSFNFGNGDGESRTAWLQVWFNITSTAPPPPPP